MVRPARSDTADTRPWWRRPGIGWVYTLVFGLTAIFAIPMASRREEMIRLACLVAPPSTSPSANATAGTSAVFPPDFGNHERRFGLSLSWNGLGTSVPIYSQQETIVTSLEASDDLDLEACKHDVDVQRLLAHINMVSQTTSGLLGAFTVSSWSSLSDRVGRCKILTIALLSVLLRDVAFLLVLYFPKSMIDTRGAILYIAPVVEGLLGGEQLLTVVWTAYIADVTAIENIALNMAGFYLLSAAVATTVPLLGPALVDAMGDRLLPFKITIMLQIVLALYVAFVVPESLSDESRAEHIQKASDERAFVQVPDPPEEMYAQGSGGPKYRWRRLQQASRRLIQHMLTPLESLTVFKPQPRSKGRGKDWNLFHLGVIIFLLSLAREETPEVQYVIYTFGWGQRELARRASLLSMWRTVTVTSIIPFYRFLLQPFLVRLMTRGSQRPPDAVSIPVNEQTPLLPPAPDPGPGDETPPARPNSAADTAVARAKALVDVGFLGTSLLLELVGYVTRGANSSGRIWPYVLGTAITIAGTPGSFVLEPLLLELGPTERKAGRVFGASGVVSALGGSFLSSLLFIPVFAATVGSYPPALFLVAAVLYVLAMVSVALIRVPFEPGQANACDDIE